MSDILQQHADLASHHIEGYAYAARARGESGKFSCPLISEIMPGLWQGGYLDDVRLPDDFDLVISLYPWRRYAMGPNTKLVERSVLDGHEVPEVSDLADMAYDAWKSGKKVLIHCQAGLNRSGYVAALVLIKDGMTPEEAIRKLKDTRSEMVLCNLTFVEALLAGGVQ